ncbi:MAG: hypothetical protein K2K59_03910 [Muribaculaceae bacterium]|nr:hypothetical protein [Muribaculaceae bacterium]
MKKALVLSATIGMSALAALAHPIDFDKIKHWTGTGPNRAALAVTNDAGAADPAVYVWGFRWEDGETPTGEDMFKAICADNDNLVLLTQITGQYGSTVCGIGVGDADKLLENIYFDFEKALNYEFINFDYYSSNSFFGQSAAPGDQTPLLCSAAVEKARTSGSHYIQHPLDHPAFGYPAYDYDCWEIADSGLDAGWWTSAWYAGYWSYWTISGKDPEWMYSGTGFTGRLLSDGCIDGWSLTMFDSPKVGGVGEGIPPSDDEQLYVYCEPKESVGIQTAEIEDNTAPEEYFTLTGRRVSPQNLTPGVYIISKGGSSKKTVIH